MSLTLSIAGQAVAVRVMTSSSNDLYYFYADHLGSASAIANSSGTVVDRAYFLPFGGYRNGDASIISERGFTGHLQNDDIGLTYMNARFYISGIGRFASPDTLVPDPINPQGFNRYSYVINNPLRMVDASGHDWGDIVDGVLDFGEGVLSQYGHDVTWVPQWRQNLAPAAGESTAMTAGRIVGGVLSTATGAVGAYGGGMITGAAVLECAGTVGLACAPAAGQAALGIGVFVYSSAIAVNGVNGIAENIQTLAAGSSGTGGTSGGTSSTGTGNAELDDLLARGTPGGGKDVIEVTGTATEAEASFRNIATPGTLRPHPKIPGGFLAEGPGGVTIGYRPVSKSGPATIDIPRVPGTGGINKIKFIPPTTP